MVYKSIAQVDLAFNTLSEAATEEASGRLQKKIFLSKDGKKYISVSNSAIVSFHDYDSFRIERVIISFITVTFPLICRGRMDVLFQFLYRIMYRNRPSTDMINFVWCVISFFYLDYVQKNGPCSDEVKNIFSFR